MDNYIVSARKYRPITFDSVIGQHALVTTLKNAIKNKQLAHAYLFCGPRGVGKTTTARIFAKTINCLQPLPNNEACNQCESCVAFNEQRSFNIHESDAASNNSVDDIRSLIDQVRIPPQIGKYSVYIIDEVHMLSQSAFNAFLKTLEEPPAHAIFILATTEKHKILPTILSRCQIYDFNRISVQDTVAHLQHIASLEGITAEPEALHVIAHKSDGGMRDALSTFDQVVSFCGETITYKHVIENLNILDYDYYFKLVDAFLTSNVPTSLLIFNEILNKGFDAHNFVVGLSEHLRDVLVCKDELTAGLLEVGASIRDAYIQQAKNCSNVFLYEALSLTNECDLQYKQSKNKRLLIELCLIKLCQILSPKNSASTHVSGNNPIQAITNHAQVATPSVSTAASKPVSTVAPTPTKTPTPPTTSTPTSQPISTTSIGSISIKQIGSSWKETTQEVKQKAEVEKRKEPFTQIQLEDAWRKFGSEIPEKHKILFLFSSKKPKLGDASKIELEVNDPLLVKDIEEIKETLMSYLKQQLKNDLLTLHVELVPLTEEHRAVTSLDKTRLMQKKHPAFGNFLQQLGLEPE
jgi:DNA polymerase III subunit gamma/tau